MEELAKDFVNKFSTDKAIVFPIIGNHDDNSYQQSNINAIFSIEEVEKMMNFNYKEYVKHIDSFVYYYDNVSERIRYICLNTSRQIGVKKRMNN